MRRAAVAPGPKSSRYERPRAVRRSRPDATSASFRRHLRSRCRRRPVRRRDRLATPAVRQGMQLGVVCGKGARSATRTHPPAGRADRVRERATLLCGPHFGRDRPRCLIPSARLLPHARHHRPWRGHGTPLGGQISKCSAQLPSRVAGCCVESLAWRKPKTASQTVPYSPRSSWWVTSWWPQRPARAPCHRTRLTGSSASENRRTAKSALRLTRATRAIKAWRPRLPTDNRSASKPRVIP